TPAADNTDNIINGQSDREDMEPLLVRMLKKPPGGRLSLRLMKKSPDDINEKSRIRVFKADGTMIIGPCTATTYYFSNEDLCALLCDDMKLFAEGLTFASSVKLSLFLDETEKDSLIVECAPFLLLPHSQPVEQNFVVRTENYCPLESAIFV